MQRAVLGMEAIFAAEGLEVEEADVSREMTRVLGEQGGDKAELDLPKLREQVSEVLKVGAPSLMLSYPHMCQQRLANKNQTTFLMSADP